MPHGGGRSLLAEPILEKCSKNILRKGKYYMRGVGRTGPNYSDCHFKFTENLISSQFVYSYFTVGNKNSRHIR